MRDDYYCSVLAYSPELDILAVGLSSQLWKWSETAGVRLLHDSGAGSWVTSVSFSSANGGKSILAFGRSNGRIGLTSVQGDHRFEIEQNFPINSVS